MGSTAATKSAASASDALTSSPHSSKHLSVDVSVLLESLCNYLFGWLSGWLGFIQFVVQTSVYLVLVVPLWLWDCRMADINWVNFSVHMFNTLVFCSIDCGVISVLSAMSVFNKASKHLSVEVHCNVLSEGRIDWWSKVDAVRVKVLASALVQEGQLFSDGSTA